MPTEEEIGQEIAVLLHAHGVGDQADLESALVRYVYRVAMDAAAAVLRPYLLGHVPTPGVVP